MLCNAQTCTVKSESTNWLDSLAVISELKNQPVMVVLKKLIQNTELSGTLVLTLKWAFYHTHAISQNSVDYLLLHISVLIHSKSTLDELSTIINLLKTHYASKLRWKAKKVWEEKGTKEKAYVEANDIQKKIDN